MSVTLPRPPRGIDFPADPPRWARSMEDWARVAAGLLEDESRSAPTGGGTGPQGPVGPAGPPGAPGSSGGIAEAPNDGQLYGRKSLAWALVPSSGPGGGIPEAPLDGITYGRQSAAWTHVLMANNDIVDGGNF
jgi:hypothetical protein